MILSVQSHTIELLLNEKIGLNHRIKTLELSIEQYKNQEKRDAQIQTPKIKLDVQWLQSMSQKKELDPASHLELESQPFQLVNHQDEDYGNHVKSRKVSNFGAQCEFEIDKGQELAQGDLQTYQFETISYSPEKISSRLDSHLNGQIFLGEYPNGFYQIEKRSLSEIKEGVENSDIFASGLQPDHLPTGNFTI